MLAAIEQPVLHLVGIEALVQLLSMGKEGM